MYNIKFKALSKRGYFTLLALLIAITSFAQEITINGVVIDETDTPLIGATVQVKNTQKGVVTDFDGKFSIKANSNATLIISYIGYKNQEIKIKGQKNLNIKLEPDNAMLDEVIVVGYGSMKKSDLTGSVSSVAAKSIEGFKTGSVVEALGGQIAGVQITQSDGTPGSGFDIKIRGVGTVNGDSSPLYIVDGFEVSSIDYLPNSDIESVEVLKDASASAIYGARAANGVVLVTTKSGKEGKAVITYNGSATYRNIPKKLDMLSTYEFAALQVELNPTKYGTTYYQEGNDSDGVPYRHQTLEDYLTDPGIDWQSESFKPTWSQNHDFSISGGTKETKYAASFSHFDENGIFTNSGYKKNAGKLRINQKITKFITFDATINYANTVKEGIGTSGTGGTLNMLSNILRFRPTGGNSVTNDELLNSVFDPLELSENTTYSQINPIKQAEAVKDRRQSELWGANAALTVQLMKNLTFKASATYNTTNTRRDLFYGENSSQAYRSGGVYGSTQMQKDLRWQSSNTLTYKKKINKKNTFDIMLGHEFSFRSSELLYGQSKDFPFPNLGNDNLGIGATPSSVSTSRSDKKLLSYFARGNYNFDNRYLFTATIRADGSTVFSAKNKWGYFPAVSAAWRVGEEDFIKKLNVFSDLKFRIGYGLAGNNRIGSYNSLALMSSIITAMGDQLTPGYASKQIPNPDLKWEANKTFNMGVDLGFLNQRITISPEFYINRSSNLLLNAQLPYSSGYQSMLINAGETKNVGVELTVNTVNFSTKKFSWNTTLTLSHNKNSVKALTGEAVQLYEAKFGFNQNTHRIAVGEPLGQFYGYITEGLYQVDDFNYDASTQTYTLKDGIPYHGDKSRIRPGMWKFKNLTGDDNVIDENDKTVIGNAQPKFYGGLNNSFTYKGFDLSIFLTFSYGNEVLNATKLVTSKVGSLNYNALDVMNSSNRWMTINSDGQKVTDPGELAALNAGKTVAAYHDAQQGDNYIHSWAVEDASYLKLSNVTLGYTFPKNLIARVGLKNLRLYATGNNLLTWTKYSGFDPEVSTMKSGLTPGVDFGAYPLSRSFIFGLNVAF